MMRLYAVAIAALSVLGCGRAEVPQEAEQPLPETRTVRGIVFDPATARRGDRIGELVLDSIEVRRAFDSTLVGTARFSGRLTLTGKRYPHPYPELGAVCFEADTFTIHRGLSDEVNTARLVPP